jgi:hypothetical protein
MSYVAPDVNAYMGQSVPNGQCVAYVKAAAGCPSTDQWASGKPARNNKDMSMGTAIATFQDGKYNNYTDGRSHAAIFLSQDDNGLVVHDQWKKRDGTFQVVHERTIAFRGGVGKPRNDGDAYSVIENQSVLRQIARLRAKPPRKGAKRHIPKRPKTKSGRV